MEIDKTGIFYKIKEKVMKFMSPQDSKEIKISEQLDYLFSTYSSDGSILKYKIVEMIKREFDKNERELIEAQNNNLILQQEEIKKNF